MRFAFPFLLLLSIVLGPFPGCASAKKGASRPERALVISIDGLLPDFYLPETAEKFPAPNLRRLLARGAYADGVVPVYPTVTFPNHASLVTGVHSAKHGVLTNTAFSWEKGPTQEWYYHAASIQVPTIWDAARQAGKKTAIVRWPVSVGAQVDWLVPGIFSSAPGTGAGTTWGLTLKNSDPELIETIQRGLPKGYPARAIEGFAPHDVWVAGAVPVVLKEFEPDLTFTHLINVDFEEHEKGRDSFEVKKALAVADEQVGRILEAVDLDETAVFVVGDHGIEDYSTLLHFNALFAKEGWITLKDGKIEGWRVIAHVTGGQAAIYARDAKLASKALALLTKHARGKYRVLDRAELDRLQAVPGAAFAVDPFPGFAAGGAYAGELVEKRTGVAGQHGTHPDRRSMHTGLIVAGPGVKPGKRLGVIELIDVAPTVAAHLGFKMPSADGKAIDLAK